MDIRFYEEYSILIDEMVMEIEKKMGTPISLLARRVRLSPKDKEILTRVQSTIIAVLFYNDGIVMSELAKKCGLSFKNLSIPVKQLEKIGYIRREADPANKKYVHAYLTDVSKDLARRVEQVGVELSKSIFEKNLNDQQLAELMEATQTVAKYYKLMPQVYIDENSNPVFEAPIKQ